jgi:hypothetical protein
MLIRFFRSSFLGQYLFLMLVTAAIWLRGFLVTVPVPPELEFIAPIYSLVTYLAALHPVISPLLSVLIVFSAALTLNNILIYHDLAPKNNLLPALLFILMMGSNPDTLCIYPILIALPLFTWFLHTIFRSNNEPDNFISVFNAGLILSVISMIAPTTVFLFLFIWIALLVFGTFNGRNLIISVMGFLLPYIYLAVYYFWIDQLPAALIAYQLFFMNLFDFGLTNDPLQFVIWGLFIGLMLLPAIYRTNNTLGSFNINFRKKMSATGWLLAFTFPMVLMSGETHYQTLIYLPSVILIGHFYNQFKKPVWHEVILLTYLGLILLNNYLPL